MGRKFGNLSNGVSGVVTYGLSPIEQKAFPHFFSKLVPNMFRRFRKYWWLTLMPFGLNHIFTHGNYLADYYVSKEYLAEHPEEA